MAKSAPKRAAAKRPTSGKSAAGRPAPRASKRSVKSKSLTKAARPAARRNPTGLARVVAVAGGVGAVALGAVKTLAHKGEELVGRVMGTEEEPAANATRRTPRVTKGRSAKG